MSDPYPECDAGFEIAEDSAIIIFLSQVAGLSGLFFFCFCIFVGPINVAVNLFVMFVLTRKELRSNYNFVFFIMALNHTIVVGILTLSMIKKIVFFDCNPWYFSLVWALFDLILTEQIIVICKAHATWLAVIIAMMRLINIRSRGTSELNFWLVLLLCGTAMVFVIIANIPNCFTSMIVWIRFDDVCPDTSEFRDLPVPMVIESPVIYMNNCLIMRLTSLLSGSLHSGLPCVLLIILTVTLLRFLHKVRREREAMILHRNEAKDGDRTTTLLILIMITTMISEVPQAIISLLEGFLSAKMRNQITSRVGFLVLSLMLITSACNLFIYLFMSKKFREVAKKYVCFPCWKFSKLKASRQSSSS